MDILNDNPELAQELLGIVSAKLREAKASLADLQVERQGLVTQVQILEKKVRLINAERDRLAAENKSVEAQNAQFADEAIVLREQVKKLKESRQADERTTSTECNESPLNQGLIQTLKQQIEDLQAKLISSENMQKEQEGQYRKDLEFINAKYQKCKSQVDHCRNALEKERHHTAMKRNEEENTFAKRLVRLYSGPSPDGTVLHRSPRQLPEHVLSLLPQGFGSVLITQDDLIFFSDNKRSAVLLSPKQRFSAFTLAVAGRPMQKLVKSMNTVQQLVIKSANGKFMHCGAFKVAEVKVVATKDWVNLPPKIQRSAVVQSFGRTSNSASEANMNAMLKKYCTGEASLEYAVLAVVDSDIKFKHALESSVKISARGWTGEGASHHIGSGEKRQEESDSSDEEGPVPKRARIDTTDRGECVSRGWRV